MSGFNTSFGNPQPNNDSRRGGQQGGNDYKKIFCAYHSTEFLTNFCTDKECLMPLCPTCVVEHTEEHYQRGQKPSYVNLHDALNQARQFCYSSIVRLQEYDRRNGELSNYIGGLQEYIGRQLGECKQKLFQAIELQFQRLQDKIMEDIKNKYADDGVYSRRECQEVREFITGQIQSLYDKIGNLKGDQCLAALIRYYQVDEKNLEHQLVEVAEYIERNRKAGGLYISLNMDQTEQCLTTLAQRAVTLEYVQNQQHNRSYGSGVKENSAVKKGVASSAVRKIAGSGVKPNSAIKGSTVKSIKETSNLNYSRQKPTYSPFQHTPSEY